MKSAIIALTLTLSAGALTAPFAIAQEHKGGKRLFAGLELSDAQKQDIQAIMRQTREDKSVFAADREAYKQQMQAIMSAPAWDAQSATALVSERISNSTDAKLNKAKARNSAFNVLDEAQQAALIEKQSIRMAHNGENSDEDTRKRAGKSRKGKGLNLARLSKRLELSDEQIAAISTIRDEHKAAVADLREELKTAKQAEKALIQSTNFNEQAWLTLHSQTEAQRIEAGVASIYQRYQILNVLDDEQKAQFEKMMNKKARKAGKNSRRDSMSE